MATEGAEVGAMLDRICCLFYTRSRGIEISIPIEGRLCSAHCICTLAHSLIMAVNAMVSGLLIRTPVHYLYSTHKNTYCVVWYLYLYM